MNLESFKTRLQRAQGEKKLLNNMLEETNSNLEEKEEQLLKYNKVRLYVQIVAESTQKKIEHQFSSLVSSALFAVFPDPYEFILKFDKGHNKTEAHPIFKKNGHEGKPFNISGGGPLDVASLGLRATTWSLNPTRKVLILDEPGKNLSRNLQPRFAQMLHMICKELGIQMIISTHIQEIVDVSDRVFTVEKGFVSLQR